VLLAVFRNKSFFAAGRALGVSTSTVARRVTALERSVGRSLVQRGQAGAFVEPDALELVSLAEQLEQGLAALRRDEPGAPAALAGTVRLSAGEGFIRPLTRLLADFRRKHPETTVELISEARLVDLARREADVGVRTGPSRSKVLIERRVGVLRFGLFAAPSYLEHRLPHARLPAGTLGRQDFVGYDSVGARAPQDAWLMSLGATQFPFRSNSEHGRLEAVLRGQGLAVLALPVAREVEGLVEVSVGAPLPTAPVFVVYHRQLRAVPRVRAVVSAVEAATRAQLA
jgi:DNA-binding transcriptional LysR family regulator